MIVSLGSRRQPVAERSRGQGMNVLPKKGME